MDIINAELEVEGQKFDNCTSIVLKQRFNEHHEFTCRYLDYNGSDASLKLTSFQHNVGKTAIIRFFGEGGSEETFYEFQGIICEACIEVNDSGSYSELVVKGYSTTIQLESGEHFATFHEKKISDIVSKIAQSAGLTVKVKTKYNTVLAYKCQYKESSFNFLNRLSSDYGEFFYYDGKNLIFGNPENSESFELTYGENILGLQLSLRAFPVKFSNYDFDEKKDQSIAGQTKDKVTGLGQFSSNIFGKSQQLFSKSITGPARNFVDNGSSLNTLNDIYQAAIAANMEVLKVKTDNPKISIGSVLKLKMGTSTGTEKSLEDYGKFLVTSIEHTMTGSGYTNSIEAIPAKLEVIPVNNVLIPIAETQLAVVKDNDDQDKMGRVQVQMLWQTKDSEKTDWISVMTPEAGDGQLGKNRGLLCIPEINDKVMIGFRYNDPDRPFVLGSVFTGKTGQGGGKENKIKSFTTQTGSIIKFEDKKISIIDASKENKILFDGVGKIEIIGKDEITLTCGQSSISMKKDGTITIKGKEVTIDATSKSTVKSGQASFTAETSGDIKMAGTNAEVSGMMGAKVKGNATAEISASGQTTVKGAIVMIN
ncbi:phage baseplate assembly protein V [soil metagenome]